MELGRINVGEAPASNMTVREVSLLLIYSAMLNRGVGAGSKAILDKAQEATAYYLQAIDPNLQKARVGAHFE